MITSVNEGISSFFKEFYFPKESKNTRRLYQTAIHKFSIFLSEKFNRDTSLLTITEIPPSIIPTYLSLAG
jgi:hypothetical protein